MFSIIIEFLGIGHSIDRDELIARIKRDTNPKNIFEIFQYINVLKFLSCIYDPGTTHINILHARLMYAYKYYTKYRAEIEYYPTEIINTTRAYYASWQYLQKSGVTYDSL